MWNLKIKVHLQYRQIHLKHVCMIKHYEYMAMARNQTTSSDLVIVRLGTIYYCWSNVIELATATGNIQSQQDRTELPERYEPIWPI